MSFKESKCRWGPEHVNSNVICAVDIRVGGTDPSTCDLLEICFIPVNHSYKMHTEFNLFNVRIRPCWPVDGRVAKLNIEARSEFEKSSNDAHGAYTMFEYWCETTLELKNQKKILPLCYDWSYIKPFLKYWMGDDGLAHYIGDSIRDVQSMMNFANDRHAFWGDEVPYPIIRESQLYSRSNIPLIEKNSLLANCKGLIDVYGQTLRSYMPGHASKPILTRNCVPVHCLSQREQDEYNAKL